MSLLELDGTSRRFGGLLAVNGMSFAVAKGEIVGLIGPNGSGKTTIFNLINGYLEPDAGHIRFKGEPIGGLKPHAVCRRGIARTFQVVKPLARMTVLDNVIVSAFSRTARTAHARAFATEAIAFTGMTPWMHTPARSLPLGMRKRLELARALATAPELLLLDENCAGLNPSEVEHTMAIVRRISESGVTIVIIEHNMRVIMSISDRIVAINYGTKIAEGDATFVANHPQVIEAYLGPAHVDG